MPSTSETIEKPSPAQPSQFKDLFILSFIRGNVHTAQTIQFAFPGDLRGAIQRGRTHCERMGTRFVGVRPFFTNLEDEEKKMMNQE